MVPVIDEGHIYQPPAVMVPTDKQMGFYVTSGFVPKVVVHRGGLSEQQSSLPNMREDFMDVVAGNFACQN